MSIQSTAQSVRQAKTVRELIYAIPQRTIGTAAMLVLCYLAILPPIASLTYDGNDIFVLDSDVQSFLLSSTFPYGDHWYRLESTVIILSLLFIAYAAAKLHYTLQDSHQTLKSWLSSHKSILFFGLLFGWAVVSFCLSSHHFLSFFGTGYRHDGLLTYMFYIGLFCMAVQLDCPQMRIVLEFFIAAGAFLGIFCVFPTSPLANLFYLHEEGYKLSIFLQRTHYGYYLSMCLPAGFLLLVTDDFSSYSKPRRVVLRILRAVEFWLLVNSLVFNATRAAIVAVIVFLAVMNVYTFFGHRDNIKAILLADVIVLATIIFLNSGNNLLIRTTDSTSYAQELHEAYTEAQRTPNNTEQLAEAANRLTSSRYSMWKCGIKYALQKPLFGWGPDNLGELYYTDGLTYTDRPHNEFIQIAAMLGFPALVFYLCGLFSWFHIVVKRSRRLDLFGFGLAMVAVSYIVNSIFSNSMFYTTPYFYMLLGFSYKYARRGPSYV